MTLQDLKNNRQAIIETITEMVGSDKVKEVMTGMVEMIGFRGYEGYNAIEFTKATIKDLGIEPTQIKTRHSDDIYAEAALRQRPSSMR